MNTRNLFFILNRSDGKAILLLRDGKHLKLPTYDEHVPEGVGFSEPRLFNDRFARRYGIKVRRRYPLDLQGTKEAFFVLEPRDEAPSIPQNTLWVRPEELGQLTVKPVNHQALINTWCKASHESATMPSSRPGGYESPLSWMHATLESKGTSATGEPQQVKNAYVSTVFRCPTEEGDVFLKIVPPVFMREPQITAKLAEWGITKLPEILAIKQERGFILTKDMGGCNLTDCLTVEKLEAVVRFFAEFQLAAVDFVNLRVPSPFYDWRICDGYHSLVNLP